ncbi:replication-associated protein [Crucivirus-113]|nr:replication-associated protein [Crucivirus-113]
MNFQFNNDKLITKENDSDKENKNPNIDKKFRINAKAFFITYPQCNLDKNKIYDLLPEKHTITEYYIAEEKHEDGNPHIHALIKYSYKRNITNCKHFDIEGFHPNVQAVKNWNNSKAYVCKDNNFISYVSLDTSTPENYNKRKKDFNEWKEDQELLSFKDITYPIKFLHYKIDKPNPNIKKRHYWFIGAPDFGKTYAIEKTFAGLKIFKRGNNKYPFEGYNNEDIIIYDDIEKISFEEISNVSNTYHTKTLVYGDTRYNKIYWKIGHTRTIIVVTNTYPHYNKLQNAFESRFYTIMLFNDRILIDDPMEDKDLILPNNIPILERQKAIYF